MNVQDMLALAACGGHFALFVLALLRAPKSPLALALALLAIDMFTWNLADLAGRWSGDTSWDYVDITASSMLTPIAAHFVVRFVGKRNETRHLIIGLYIWFGGVALACALAPVVPLFRAIVDSPLRTYPVLATSAPVAFLCVWWLESHRRSATTFDDRGRSALVLAAFAIGTFGALTELFAEIGFHVPRLGASLTLAATLVLAIVVLRWRLFQTDLSTTIGATAALAGVLVVSGYVWAFTWLENKHGALLFATLSFALVLAAIVWRTAARGADRRMRLEHHATMGRLSAQLAHDLRNPLAAMKGALQLMDGTSAPESSRELLSLVTEQVSRMESVITTYQRLGRVEPVFANVETANFVRDVALEQKLAAPAGVNVVVDVSDVPKTLSCDSDLLRAALENVIRNAYEAMPEGGTLTVRTTVAKGMLTIAVTDTGTGMDASVVDSLGKDFFTTKTTGSGLGLSFARRVLEAHLGHIGVESRPGAGTTVRFVLPV